MRDCILCLHKTVDGCDSWKCEYINRYDAAEAYRQTRWIPVTERVPERTGAFLVTCQNENVKVGHFTTFNNEWTDAKAVAWMPLPAPYQEEV